MNVLAELIKRLAGSAGSEADYKQNVEFIHSLRAPAVEDQRPSIPIAYDNSEYRRIGTLSIPEGVGLIHLSRKQLRELVTTALAGKVDGWGLNHPTFGGLFLSLVKPDGSLGESITGDTRDPHRRRETHEQALIRRAEIVRKERKKALAIESAKRAEADAQRQRAEQARRDVEEHRAAKQKALEDAMALCTEANGIGAAVPEDEGLHERKG